MSKVVSFFPYKNNRNILCVSCKKSPANKNSSVKRARQNRLMLVSNFYLCGNKESEVDLKSRS